MSTRKAMVFIGAGLLIAGIIWVVVIMYHANPYYMGWSYLGAVPGFILLIAGAILLAFGAIPTKHNKAP